MARYQPLPLIRSAVVLIGRARFATSGATCIAAGLSTTTSSRPTSSFTLITIDVGKGVATFAMGYGLPGKPEYSYDRPFDYFNFEFALDTVNGVESVFSRGLLYGADYTAGPNYRGVWGVYGLYDYVAPNIFRVSNTAAAVGTTSQWWLSRSIALQASALTGVGYAGGGVIHGAGVVAPGPNGEGARNYHYGLTPESLVALRLRYSLSNREGRYRGLPDSHQRVSVINLGYTLLGHAGFGAVDWRKTQTPDE